jgi:hypothetical protein
MPINPRAARQVLRPLPWIVAAYLCAPLAGLTVMLAPVLFNPDSWLWREGGDGWKIAGAMLGIGFIGEVFIATPMLLAYRNRPWPWLTPWTGAALGAGVVLVPMLFSPDTRGQLDLLVKSAFIGGAAGLVFNLLAARTVSADTRGRRRDRPLSPHSRPNSSATRSASCRASSGRGRIGRGGAWTLRPMCSAQA